MLLPDRRQSCSRSSPSWREPKDGALCPHCSRTMTIRSDCCEPCYSRNPHIRRSWTPLTPLWRGRADPLDHVRMSKVVRSAPAALHSLVHRLQEQPLSAEEATVFPAHYDSGQIGYPRRDSAAPTTSLSAAAFSRRQTCHTLRQRSSAALSKSTANRLPFPVLLVLLANT